MNEDYLTNPIIMYLIVHDIGMSPGKIAAQCGHAVGMLYARFQYIQGLSFAKERTWNMWLQSNYRKVVLSASSKKWEKIKKDLTDKQMDYVIVKDLGLTEIPSGTETVIGVFPIFKSNKSKILKKLQVLK
jgi:peptidyl-tRNA hydrolase, PTH2 family